MSFEWNPTRRIAWLLREGQASGLEPSLLELIRLRASQIDVCAYDIRTHSKDPRPRAGGPSAVPTGS